MDAHFEGVQPAALPNTVLSSTSESVAEAEREEPHGINQVLFSGSLKNTDTLRNLDFFLFCFLERFYRVSAERRKHLDAEVKSMLENGIAESPCSKRASLYLVFRKINSVAKPDAFPLSRMNDCIDQVGSANKFDLLEEYWQVPVTERAQKHPLL